jgi:hypothetical protein
MAGFATRPSFAGHTGRSAKTNYNLTLTTKWGPARSFYDRNGISVLVMR